MFLKKLVYLTAFIAVVCATESEFFETLGVKRSAVCLVHLIAVKNNISISFEKVIQERNGATDVECKLLLGTEQYLGHATSFSRAKDKVSREAYALTKYTKPTLKSQTCLLPPTKSDISLLSEYGQAIGKHPLFEEGKQNNRMFQSVVTLGDQSAEGSGHKKQSAKSDAATHLIEKIGRAKVIDTLTLKYNRTEYHSMEPTLRLRKIIRVTDLTGDGEYRKTKEEPGRFVVQVDTKDYMAAGSGSTYDEARSNAAANILRNMNFVVTYHP